MLKLASISLVLVGVLVACGGSVDDRAEAAGGTPAPDGASGYCCPARTGGCALSGGFRESGDCPTDWDLCDGMCAQQIVKDDHGCDKLTYTPCAGNLYHRPDAIPDASTSDADADAGEK